MKEQVAAAKIRGRSAPGPGDQICTVPAKAPESSLSPVI